MALIKKHLLPVFVLVFFSGNLFSQSSIEAKNASTGKTRNFKLNSKIYFRTESNSEYIKGKISRLTDTSVVLILPDEDESSLVELNMKEIQGIKKPTTLHKISYAVGSVFFLTGGYMMAESSSIAGEDNSSAPYLIGGGVLLVAGAAPFVLIHPKEYLVKDGWAFSVKK